MTFTRKNDLEADSMLDALSPAKKAAAKLIGLNPTYVRISGDVNLRITQGGKETYNQDSNGIWEQMFFGSNRTATINTTRP